VFAVQKMCLFCGTEIFKTRIGFQASWEGGHGGGNRRADSGVLAALYVFYLPKTCRTVMYWVFRVWAGSIQCHAKLGFQAEEEGSKRRRRIDVHGGPVEGEREEGGKTTLTLHELIMQQLIAHDRNDPTVSLSSFLAWVILVFFR